MNYIFKEKFLEILKEVSAVSYMPISVGGKIRSYEDARDRILNGAEKVVLNYLTFNNINEIEKIIKNFGSQAVIASIDYTLDIDNKHKVVISGEKIKDIYPIIHCKMLTEVVVGEIFFN